ncbi:hypothetical protein F3Y22_tig00117010pilonHSYRG00034 [Hibiscus syriacus]|uniref:Uncharacterized protein n=1 Tax=Hibiscus syriacus TaxID=106335 RepID=A0A6A2WPP3_HIBSY|nr:uncharacterized protein LOC120195197 [Hibiscus syriacus]KAE8656090.1 hypothetical protein F3Y22_tig00117010pilonHSYRG00034 [Hibiscus syriacus]
MRGRETKGVPSADLLVCLPSRARLTLVRKPICSPTRPSESNKHHRNHQHHLHYHRRLLKKSSTRKGSGAGSHSSPLLWARDKQIGPDSTEPTSPKVTCSGQIKVGSKTSSCKTWQSVMEEIEKIHNSRHRKRRPSWVESFGFKKEVVQFLTCLRGIRFDFRCFGSFPRSDITSDDEDEDEEYQENRDHEDEDETSGAIFSKWLMVLQENHDNGVYREEETRVHDPVVDDDEAAIPPPNALLLMRSRSAPAIAKARQEENEEDENKTNKLDPLMEEKRELGGDGIRVRL